jgi:flagellar biosynthesis protein FlhB
MADTDKDSKTEEPTGKRLHDALEKGQFAKAPEITLVVVIAATMGVLSLTLGSAVRDVADLSANIFSQVGAIKLSLDTVPNALSEIVILIAKVLLPIIGSIILAVLLSGGLQSGFNFTPEAFGFKPERLDIAAGFQRLIAKETFVHGAVDLLKLVAISLILWGAAQQLVEDPLFSAPVDAGYLGTYLNRATMAFLSRLILALGIIAAISYWYEFMKTRSDMRMTKQEVKDEHKQTEGDGRVKGAMRRMARRLLQKQMLEQVPTADVVVTNPTHYAVALRYERGVDQAPIVLAKGENQFAKRIKAMAAEHGVPTVENRPVARMLYALGRVDEPIPNELYQAVAGILAVVYRSHRYYFYRLKAKRAEIRTQAAQDQRRTAAATPGADVNDRTSLTEAA